MSRRAFLYKTSLKSRHSALKNSCNALTLAWKVGTLARPWWTGNLRGLIPFSQSPSPSNQKLMAKRCWRLLSCILWIWLAHRGKKWPMHLVIGWSRLEISINHWQLSVWSSTLWPVIRQKLIFPIEIQSWLAYWEIVWEGIPRLSSWQQSQPPSFASRKLCQPWTLLTEPNRSKSRLLSTKNLSRPTLNSLRKKSVDWKQR